MSVKSTVLYQKKKLPALLTYVVAGSRTPRTAILCNSTTPAEVGHSESGSRAERASARRTDLTIVNYVSRKGRLPRHEGSSFMLMQSQVEHVSLLVLERKLHICAYLHI